MTSGDWLPAQAPFDVVRRGFSPEQVTAHLERLEYDLRITTADRDATNQRLRELGGQLAAAQGESDMLRAQLDRSALEPVSMSNLSDRMQRMIRLAEEEASEIRARSEADADRLRGQLEQSLSEAGAARAAFDAERERTRKQLAEQVHGLIAEASTEAEQTRTSSQDEAARLLQGANAEAERTVADARQHAQQLLDDANRESQQQLGAAADRAQQTVAAAEAAAAALTARTAAERERLDAASLAHRTQVEDDFEIAIAGRRAEAQRVLTEREAASVAAAGKLVADATAHANELVAGATARAEELVAGATAEADRLRQQATASANALVNRAAAESHQRVADADRAVEALVDLRAQIFDQLHSLTGHLDHIRALAGSAPELIALPAGEATRPVADEFPADPSKRPTPVDLPLPEDGMATPPAHGGSGADVPARGGDLIPESAPAGDDPAGDDPAGDDSAGDDSAGDDSAGDGSAGDDSAGEPASAHRIRTRGGRMR